MAVGAPNASAPTARQSERVVRFTLFTSRTSVLLERAFPSGALPRHGHEELAGLAYGSSGIVSVTLTLRRARRERLVGAS